MDDFHEARLIGRAVFRAGAYVQVSATRSSIGEFLTHSSSFEPEVSPSVFASFIGRSAASANWWWCHRIDLPTIE